jgi:UDP-N-acetylmuramoyl-L-alanyl-D-glutamate--2,6-diaminopimelate ligase
MMLSTLLKNVMVRESSSDMDVDIQSIRMDSRKIKSGDLFAAVKDFYRDAHSYIAHAVEQGAAAVLLSDAPTSDIGVPWVRVHNVLEYLGPMCSTLYGHPSTKLAVVGITGTNGKTTTAQMIESILHSASIKSGFIGTTGVRYGDIETTTGLTTPEAPEFQELLFKMEADGVQAAAVEVSSHGIALKRVHGTQFTCGVFTGLGRDHLDFHEDMTDYTETKVNWMLGEVDHSPIGQGAVVPLDDETGRVILSEFRGRIYTFSFDDDADIYPQALKYSEKGTQGRLVSPHGSLSLNLNVPGKHNVRNAMAAAGAALIMDIEPIAIVEGLQRFRGVPGRFESIANDREMFIYIDYAHTPDALRAALGSLREISSGRVIVVFGCGGDRDRLKRPEMAHVAVENADLIVVTSDNPRSEDPESIVNEILAGIPGGADGDRVFVELDRTAAITAAIKMAKPGDAILVAGKGHESGQIIGDKVIPFDDAKVVAEVLGS